MVAWNQAATAVFGDHAALPPAGRNLLRQVFTNPAVRAAMLEWDQNARRIVAALRGGQARVGPSAAIYRRVRSLGAGR